MKLNMSRRGVICGIAASVAVPVGANAAAPAILSGKGDFRALSILNNRTGEKLNSVYWVEGSYIPEALEAFNYVMRDWRQNESIAIDTRVIDILAATQNVLDATEPFEIISGYRSPKTNAMLRARSRGVARNSYHTRGMAVDVTLKTRSVGQMASAAKSLSAGGVGRYSRSQFVHMDSGPVRGWGR
ncbi:MAG: YcbK family protein [Paracoccaceae bacterium]